MPRLVALPIFIALIAWLFWLDRDKEAKTSKATWLSFIWIGLAASRSAAQWVYLSAPVDAGDLQMEGSPIDRTVYALLLGVGLAVLASRRKRTAKILASNLLIVLFFGYCLFSLFWSDFPDVGFKRWTKAVGDLVMLCIVLTEADPPFAIQQLLKRLTFLLAPLSVLLIKYFPEYGRTYGRWFGEVHYTGVTTNKNSLGAICLLFGLAVLAHLIFLLKDKTRKGRKRMLLANGIVLSTIMWLLSMADSMTSWACFAMGSSLIVGLSFSFLAKRRQIIHVVIPIMLLACVSVLFLGVSPGALNALGKNATLTDRTAIWPLVLSLQKNPLGGTGFGSFWLGPRLEAVWSVFEWKPNQAHNGYLEVYLNLGWIGILLLAGVLVTGYKNAFAACRRDPRVGTLLLAYFVVGIAYNFTEAAMFQMLSAVWILLMLSMVAHAAIRTRTHCSTGERAGASGVYERRLSLDHAGVATTEVVLETF